MLTKQHRFVTRLADADTQRIYKTHMCGLCHGLGDQYGLPMRLLTSHDLILLNLLIDAQRLDEPTVRMRRCPLNPLHKVRANQGAASEFAAATAIALTRVSVMDDIQDSAGRDGIAHILQLALARPYQSALHTLKSLGFAGEVVTQLMPRQTAAEQQAVQDASQPSAQASAELFAMTARLAENPRNEAALASIGAGYGAYLYLMDAFRDYPRDIKRGHYNPLRRFSGQSHRVITLSVDGLIWIRERFAQIHILLAEEVHRLELYRYQSIIHQLLCQPLDQVIRALDKQIESRRGLAFSQWGWSDAVKAAAFIVPTPVSVSSGFTLIQDDWLSPSDHLDWAGRFIVSAIDDPDVPLDSAPRQRTGQPAICGCTNYDYDSAYTCGSCGEAFAQCLPAIGSGGCDSPGDCNCDGGSGCDSPSDCNCGDSASGCDSPGDCNCSS